MLKVYISSDEMYPVFSLHTPNSWAHEVSAEVDQEFFDEYLRVEQEWNSMQDQLDKLHNEASRR